VGGLRVDRKHFGGDGGLCGARRAAMHCVYSRGQDCVGQALAVDGLWRADGAVEDRLRRMPEAADQTGAAVPDLSAELGEPVPAGGAEDPGDGDCGADGRSRSTWSCRAGTWATRRRWARDFWR
jgi:hypothetical protein